MESRRLHCGVKVIEPPHIVPGALRPRSIFLVEFGCTNPSVRISDAPLVDEIGQPVLPRPVCLGRLLYHFGQIQLESVSGKVDSALYRPGQDSAARLLRQNVSVILHTRARRNRGVEGDHNQPPPGSAVSRPYTGQVVGEQDKGVGLSDHLRLFEFLLNHELVGAGKLLEGSHGKALVFLQLSGDYQPLSPQCSQGCPLVAPVSRNCLDVNATGVVTQNSAQGVEVGAFAEPLGIAYNGVHKAGDIMGKNLLVMGAGPIGCLCAAAAKACGADRVTVVDIRNKPLDIALEMGADFVCNSKENPEQIEKWCEHKGAFDTVIEATGNGFAAVQAMKMLRPEGVFSQVGMYGLGHEPKDLGAFTTKGIKWNSVFRFYDEFGPCVNALERGLVNPLPLLSASFPASEINEAMQAALSPETAKVQIRFD